jgi:hypothetical protein
MYNWMLRRKETDNTVITDVLDVTPLKLTLLVLAFNVIGFAEGYLLHELGLQWVVPIIVATALGAVLLSRRWLKRAS